VNALHSSRRSDEWRCGDTQSLTGPSNDFRDSRAPNASSDCAVPGIPSPCDRLQRKGFCRALSTVLQDGGAEARIGLDDSGRQELYAL
jgi:hypothetical protein